LKNSKSSIFFTVTLLTVPKKAKLKVQANYKVLGSCLLDTITCYYKHYSSHAI